MGERPDEIIGCFVAEVNAHWLLEENLDRLIQVCEHNSGSQLSAGAEVPYEVEAGWLMVTLLLTLVK